MYVLDPYSVIISFSSIAHILLLGYRMVSHYLLCACSEDHVILNHQYFIFKYLYLNMMASYTRLINATASMVATKGNVCGRNKWGINKVFALVH